MNKKENLRELGLRRLLEYRARCLDTSREIQQDADGNWRLLKSDEQKRVDDLLDEAQRCTLEFESRRRQTSDATDASALAEAMQRQFEVSYSRAEF